ncbi:MAG: hypothetical protein KAR39_03675 [Thermoplasmata archaeon]|nr:hypothetical protein [Thermoplasmata archaeon]
MEIDFKDKRISFPRELSKLDELALHFSEQLSSTGIKHVFLSGYIAILFGRNRMSEDIGVVCEVVSFETFDAFWKDIHETLDCIITSDPKDAYDVYLRKGVAIRFAHKGEFIPNVEMKFKSTEMHREALSHALDAVVNERHIPISPLEQQIAYKLFMASEKDIEDARFLFKLFQENLEMGKLSSYLDSLEVPLETARRYLGWSE